METTIDRNGSTKFSGFQQFFKVSQNVCQSLSLILYLRESLVQTQVMELHFKVRNVPKHFRLSTNLSPFSNIESKLSRLVDSHFVNRLITKGRYKIFSCSPCLIIGMKRTPMSYLSSCNRQRLQVLFVNKMGVVG